MKNPYGLREGTIILASDPVLERGLACGCVCPSCGVRPELHRGEVIAPYFAHDDGADCASAAQTALHMLAKEVLEEERTLRLPMLLVIPSEHLGPPRLRR